MGPGLLWSVKIDHKKAFIYLGTEKLKHHREFEKVLRVEKSSVKGKDALLVRANLFNNTFKFFSNFSTRCLIVYNSEILCFYLLFQFHFEPAANGSHSKCQLKLTSFNRYQSDGKFKEKKEKDHEKWISQFNKEIKKLYSDSTELGESSTRFKDTVASTTTIANEVRQDISRDGVEKDKEDDDNSAMSKTLQRQDSSLEISDVIVEVISLEDQTSFSGMQLYFKVGIRSVIGCLIFVIVFTSTILS